MDQNISLPSFTAFAAFAAFAFEGAPLRVTTRDGEPWFLLHEVCKVLDIKNVGDASSRLDDDEKGSIGNPDATSAGGNPNVTIINESGLYSLILTSRKAEAKRFKKWVTGEVLPAIRKTGGYGQPGPDFNAMLNDPSKLRVLLGNYAERMEQLAAEIGVLQIDRRALNRLANADGLLGLTEAAKALGMQPQRFVKHLQAIGWIYRRTGGKNWLGFQTRIQQGFLEHKIHTQPMPDLSERIYETVKITAKGMAALAKLLNVDLPSGPRLI